MGDSAGLGPQDPSEPAQRRPDPTGPNGTTPSDRPSWLFQKGNTYGAMRKHRKGPMEKYIRNQTKSGSVIVEFFLTVASGQPFPMKYIVHLPLSPAQYAVVRGIATPEQRTIAKKQQPFIVLTMPYYPTVKDVREAMWWLTKRGLGKVPKIVPIEGQPTTGFRMEYRPWAPGTDPVTQGDRVVDGKAETPPDESFKDERIVGNARTRFDPRYPN